MKKFILLMLVVLQISCDSEKANNCFQAAGKITTQEVVVAPFTKIRVNRDISLVLTEGLVQQVTIETGENLINDVEVVVQNDQLVLTEHNTCNFVRDYNVTKVLVTSPNITDILISTQFDVLSNGVLNYPNLELVSEDFTDTSVIAVGNVQLDLNSQNIRMTANNLTRFTLAGFTENLNISFPSGDGLFQGTNLIANTVSIFHRGSNNIIVNPQNKLTGELRGTGNIIAKNHPPIVNVNQFYTGMLIFE